MGKICNYHLLNAFRTRNLHIPRALVFAAWLVAAYAFIIILLVNLSGVSLELGRNAATGEWLPKLKNPGLELVSWNLEGPPPVAINNYFRYTLFLNRLCVVDRARSRAEYGTCMRGIPSLAPHTIDAMAPNSALSKSRPFSIVGPIDLMPVFFCFVVAAATLLVAMVTLLPDLIGNGFFTTATHYVSAPDRDWDDWRDVKLPLHEQWSDRLPVRPALRHHHRTVSNALPTYPTALQSLASFWLAFASIALALSAACMVGGSLALTLVLKNLVFRLQFVADVTNVQWHSTPLVCAWTATALVTAAALVLGVGSLVGNYGHYLQRWSWSSTTAPQYRGYGLRLA